MKKKQNLKKLKIFEKIENFEKNENLKNEKKDQSKALLGVAVWPSRKCDLKRSGPKLTRPLGTLELKSPWPYNFR